MRNATEPSAHDSANFWDKPDSVLRQTLLPFVDHPDALSALTREELQREIRALLKDSVGA